MDKTTKIPIADTQKPWQALGLLVPFFRQYAVRLIIGFAALLGVDFFQLLIPRIIKQAVDALQQKTATPVGLLKYGGFILLLALGIAVFRFGWRYLILGFSRLLEKNLRNRLFSRLLTLDRPFFQHKTTGEFMALATNDLAAVQLAVGMGLVAMVDAVVMTMAALAFMTYINPKLTIIAVSPLPFLAILTRLLAARLHRRFKKVQEQFSRITEFARSSLASIRLIKSYTQESAQTERFNKLGHAYIINNLKLSIIQGTLFPVSGFIANLGLLLVVFYGGSLTIKGRMSIGDLVAFMTYLHMLTWPMMALGWVTNLFQRGITSLDRIRAIIRTRPTLRDPAAARDIKLPNANFSIRKLTFRYDRQSEAVLNNLSLDIKPGILGITGRTGSGKTTLCHLLARLYPVKDGAVFLNGRDVNKLKLTTVRRHIAYVPQEVFLFSDTIAANIAMGRPDADQDKIEEVAKAAAIHDEIMNLAKGYQSRAGERGVKLSGGQRQRISLARALLLERPIIIIDDGLAAVDMETEHAIVRAIRPYLRGKTCIMVSHRIAPLMEADEIIVLERGRIIERGAHAELIANKGYYATIHKHQTS